MVGKCDFTISKLALSDSNWTPETSTIFLARELTPTLSISVEQLPFNFNVGNDCSGTLTQSFAKTTIPATGVTFTDSTETVLYNADRNSLVTQAITMDVASTAATLATEFTLQVDASW